MMRCSGAGAVLRRWRGVAVQLARGGAGSCSSGLNYIVCGDGGVQARPP